MNRRRPRGPKQTGRRLLRYGALFAAILLLANSVSPITPASAFTNGETARHSSVNVVDDSNGALGLDKTPDVQDGATQCLVVVTNRLTQETTVTVALADNSTDLGHLEVSLIDSLNQGDTVQFVLSSGDSQTVKLAAAADTNGSTAYYEVNASTSGLYTEAPGRSAPIVNDSTTGC